MPKNNSIIFINPDYHCSFILKNEFKNLGWKSDIYIPPNYPEMLLYENNKITFRIMKKIKNIHVSKYFQYVYKLFVLFSSLFRYRFFLFYANMNVVTLPGENILKKYYGDSFNLFLSLGKILKKNMIFVPSGCKQNDLKSIIKLLDDGNVCNNCTYEFCNDSINSLQFAIHKRYGNYFMSPGIMYSTQLRLSPIKYKSLDLTLWNPNLLIPKKYKLPRIKNIRILHSFFHGYRKDSSKNIKGSSFIFDAIEKLKSEGFKVEYYYIKNIESKYMRYYQVQADIVIDQLIYGWWGSTGIETLALGKPVICYMREEWKANFLKNNPEIKSIPVINANTNNIYEVLKNLIVDKNLRLQKGLESRQFAEKMYDAKKNVKILENKFLELL